MQGGAVGRTSFDVWSLLFVPADTDRFLAKAAGRGADALILDLEDGVAHAAKPAARANLAAFVPQLQSEGAVVHVRVNNEPQLLMEDLQAAVTAGADGLLLPKIECAEQLVAIDAQLHQLEQRHGRAAALPLAALLESPLALCNAATIARACSRLQAMLFGVEDFCASMEIESSVEAMLLPAQTMAIAAVAAGVHPLGLPGSVADFTDLHAYRELAVRARRIGMRGAVCIHPAQVSVLNEVFGGMEEDAQHARRLLEVFDAAIAAGKGAVSHEGRMVDEPVAARARRFLARRERLQAKRTS